MKRMFFIAWLCTIALLSACSEILDDAEYAEDIRLGAKEKIDTCAALYGECAFDVVANCKYTARIINGSEWLSFTESGSSETTLEGDATISLSYTSNRGFRRCGLVVLSAEARHDTLRVMQEGQHNQYVHTDTEQFDVPGEGGSYSVGILTNLIKKDFRFETLDDKDFPVIGKVEEYDFSDNIFSFNVLPSNSRDDKTFKVRIYTIDGWGEKVFADIHINQKAGRE